jgi:hypothetical protein
MTRPDLETAFAPNWDTTLRRMPGPLPTGEFPSERIADFTGTGRA